MYLRIAEPQIRTALRDTRVVAISGPRQSGKTTLARRFAKLGRKYVTLDNQSTLAAAKSDPVAFIRSLDRAVIDEVQRAPDLLLAIKQSVDEDRRPGRFLLTGSANLLTVKTIHESLAGRVEIVPLYPLGRSEQLGIKHPQFIAKAFRGAVPDSAEDLSKEKLSDWVAAGGYPEALKRRSERRRQDWYRAYIKSILERDLPEISNLAKPDQVPRVLQIAAAGQLTNLSEIGRSVGLDHKTADHYVRVLEQLYLIQRVQPWFRNELSRLVKTPKLHFIDSGLLTAMRGYSLSHLRADRTLFGALLESFVFSELLKLSAWTEERVMLFHYRDRDKLEVDFVLENSAGEIVGIAFKQGIVLYDGVQTLSFADNLRAVPLSALWA